MGSWKDMVAKKLSRILTDSSSSPRSPRVESPAAKPEPQAICSQEFASPKKSFSSHFLSILSSTSCFDGSEQSSSLRHARSSSRSSRRSDQNSSSHGARSSPRSSYPSEQNPSLRGARSSSCSLHPSEQNSPALGVRSPRSSRSKRWRVKFFTRKDGSNYLEEHGAGSESNKISECSKGNMDNFPDSHISGSHSTSHDPCEYLSYFTEKSTFMSAELFEFLQSSLPNIVKGCQWILLYSTWKHGISLHTLLRNSVNFSGPCLLMVGDMQGAVFGGLLDSPPKPNAKRKYQGTNQAFVFTTIYGEPRLFRATGENRYYYLCLNDVLAFGGGGSSALYLDEELLHGTSGPCETFGNLCLAHSPEFELKNVELWGFAHSSHYLT